MREILLSSANLPFTVALGVLAALIALELLSWVLGFALSHVLDSALNVDLDHGLDIDHGMHAEHGVDVGHETPMAVQVLDWLHVGAVPIFFLFLIFLAGFGLTGIGIQELMGRHLNVWLACLPATVGGLAGVKLLGGFSRKFLFREDTAAVSGDSLIGQPAIITLGATRRGTPSQAKVKDKHGLTHYVVVEALREEDELSAGETVLLVQRDGHKYYVIENSVDTLLSLGPEDLSAEIRQKA